MIDNCYQNFIEKIPEDILVEKYYKFFHNNYDLPNQCYGMMMVIYMIIKDLLSYE